MRLNLSAILSLPTKCCLTGIVCRSLAVAASFHKAAEANTTNKGKPEKNGKTQKIKGLKPPQKKAGKRQKSTDSENCDPNLACPKGFITDFDSSSFSCPETLLKVAIQVTKCATMILYCRVSFLNFSGNLYHIGKSREILSSMCGCLSEVWSLVVGFAAAKWPRGVQTLW